jgi:hypothetical protein
MTATRYAILVGVAATSVWGMLGVSGGGGRQFLVDAGHAGADAKLLLVVLLLGMALTTGVSICRFVMFGAPSTLGKWCAGNKPLVFAVLGCGMLGGAVYLM